jgi:DNA-binding response OmpR family regulator
MQSENSEVLVNPPTVVDEAPAAGGIPNPAHNHRSTIRTGNLVIDLKTRIVSVDDKPVRLTVKECSMIELLALRQGITVSKDMRPNY